MHERMAEVQGPTVAERIESGRYTWQSEMHLQAEIAHELERQGIDVRREVVLADGDRIDMLIGATGVEVKIKGSVQAVTRQLQRYAHSADVEALVLATTRPQHRDVPTTIGGKPVSIAVISGAAW